jgi:CRP-like cAMP-binding protein
MNFHDFLKMRTTLTDLQLDEFVSRFERKQLPAGRFLLRKGQIADSSWFLEEGFCRSYYINNEIEHTVWIEAPGELICEIKSTRLQRPTDYCIQAMEPIVYYSIKSHILEKMAAESSALQFFMTRLWETRFIIAMDGLRAFQTLNAKDRYDFLMKSFPNMEKLSLYQMANILGITQSSLSRIRRQK